MDLKRFFFFEPVIEETVTLRGAEYIHAVRVCRAKLGYKFIACNNTEFDYHCTAIDIGKDYLIGCVDKKLINETYNDINLVLYVGVCKELDTVVQKAVEMGVSKIVPFFSQHTNEININIERLKKIVLESSKQTGRSQLAEITPCLTFAEAVKHNSAIKNKFLFYEFERKNRLQKYLDKTSDNICIFIGGEGGFSEEEKLLASENNFQIVTLGKRILRVSTAVVAALALCHNATGRI